MEYLDLTVKLREFSIPFPPQPIHDLDAKAALFIGGRSKRMGTPKSLLPKGKTTLGNHLADLLTAALGTKPILVGKGDMSSPWDEEPQQIDDPRIPGPLGGFAALEANYPHTSFIILAVDMYYFDAAALQWLITCAVPNPGTALWPKFPGRPFGEPMAAYYSAEALSAMVSSGLAGEIALHRALDRNLRSEPVIPHEHQRAFRNVNRPEDLPCSKQDL